MSDLVTDHALQQRHRQLAARRALNQMQSQGALQRALRRGTTPQLVSNSHLFTQAGDALEYLRVNDVVGAEKPLT